MVLGKKCAKEKIKRMEISNVDLMWRFFFGDIVILNGLLLPKNSSWKTKLDENFFSLLVSERRAVECIQYIQRVRVGCFSISSIRYILYDHLSGIFCACVSINFSHTLQKKLFAPFSFYHTEEQKRRRPFLALHHTHYRLHISESYSERALHCTYLEIVIARAKYLQFRCANTKQISIL